MKLLPSILCLLLATPLFGDEQEIFEKGIKPLLNEYCLTCHSTEKQKGELDLERFGSLDLVKGDPAVWGHSLDQILDGGFDNGLGTRLFGGDKIETGMTGPRVADELGFHRS